MPSRETNVLQTALRNSSAAFDRVLAAPRLKLQSQEVGRVQSLANGVARVDGLPGAQLEELILFPKGRVGLAFNLDVKEVGVILLDACEDLTAGAEVRRTERVLDVPVGENLLGRVVDGLGRPLDSQGPIHTPHRLPVEREAPPIMHRAPVTVPLQTGLKVVDSLIPIGRGQRQLILGDRQTGKTAVALDALLNQAEAGVLCIYCGVGQHASAVAKLVSNLKQRDALAYSLVVIATEDDPPGLQYVTPYAAMSMGEYFMERGRDVLVILDDLTKHARAYRELSLLLRRPPGREAFPGDIFYIHSRLLERSTHLRPEFGGGSLTALAICETEAQNLSAYIPTNLISITDGQVYLSPDLFQKGVLPAVDVGKSVSRVGGKTQLRAYRGLAGELRLAYAQFAELEAFARFGTRLDPEVQKALNRGRRVREILKQNQYEPRSVLHQITMLIAATSGLLDAVKETEVASVEDRICRKVSKHAPEVGERIVENEKLTTEDQEELRKVIRSVLEE